MANGDKPYLLTTSGSLNVANIRVFRIRSKTCTNISEGNECPKTMEDFILSVQRRCKKPERDWERCGTTSLDSWKELELYHVTGPEISKKHGGF